MKKGLNEKRLNEIFDEIETLMIDRKTTPMQEHIERIMRRHLFYEKGDINKTIELSSIEIAAMIEKMLDDLYNQRRNNM
jgi:hypothetical protein